MNIRHGVALDDDLVSGQSQFYAYRKGFRPLIGTMWTIDDHPAGGNPVTDLAQFSHPVAYLVLDRVAVFEIVKRYLQRFVHHQFPEFGALRVVRR